MMIKNIESLPRIERHDEPIRVHPSPTVPTEPPRRELGKGPNSSPYERADLTGRPAK